MSEVNWSHYYSCAYLYRLILLAVVLLTEHAQSRHGLRKSQLPVVGRLLELCWTSWSKAEEEAKLKELEEQNLYRYRQKSHVIDDGDDDAALEEQLKGVFPDYSGYMEEESCDIEGEGVCSEPSPSTESSAIGFSSEELQSIAGLHLMLYHSQEAATSLGGPSRVQTAARMSYDLAGHLAGSLGSIPGAYVCNNCMNTSGHLLEVCTVLTLIFLLLYVRAEF